MATEFMLYNVEEKDLFRNKPKEEREKLLLEMVEYALKYGNKPAARKYNTYPSTIRRWIKIYNEYGPEGLKYQNKSTKFWCFIYVISGNYNSIILHPHE